ncbi:MAG: MCE family protein [Candidatus Hydrogenedentes bacterium]|nr:MCE family protein [Candidatus Hydrogenedentota bacterium]
MPSSKHNFARAEITAGILVTLAAIAFSGFIVVVLGMRQPRPMYTYHASFTKIIGLNPSADVRFGGVKAGYISQIEPDPNDQSLIRVTVLVDENIPVNAKSVATIEQITLTAEKHLEISTGDSEAPLLQTGDNLQALTLSGGFIEMPDLGGIIMRVEKVLDDVIEFTGVDLALQEEKEDGKPFVRLRDITDSAHTALNNSGDIISNVQEILKREDNTISAILIKITDIENAALKVTQDISDMLDENRPALKKGMEDVTKTVAVGKKAVEKVSTELEVLLDSLQEILDNTSGLTETAHDMIDQNRPALEQSIIDVQQTIRHLKTFARTLAEEPTAVIRGKQPTGR